MLGFVYLAISAVVLTVGAELFAEHATGAGRRLGVSALAVGLVLAGAEPEEMITAIFASVRHHPGIAAGDAIGANVTMLTAVLGLAALARPLRFPGRVRTYALAASAAGVAAAVLLTAGRLRPWAGGLLVGLYLLAVGLVWWRERQPPAFGEAADGHEAVRMAHQHTPDVVLMDIRMPELDGIAATRIIAGPDAPRPTRVVILTTYDLDEYVFDALAAGASGFLLKDVLPEELVRGIRLVSDGDALLAPGVTRRLIAEFAQHRRRASKAPSALATLTPREIEVLQLIARGHSNSEIADTLFLSENTIKTHITHLLDKLSLRDRVQAVIYAYENDLIRPGET